MTTSARVERKLTTILAADAAGYSSAMDADEVGTVEALRAARDVFSKFIARHNGRIVNTAGDGLVAEFPSVVEAVQCAIEVQRELGDAGHPANGALRFRIGIHLGDVLIDGEDLLGEGVNLAARLQTMAEPGGVLVSQQVYDQVRSKLSVGFEYLGEKRPKNFSEDVAVYCVSFGDAAPKPFFGRRGAEHSNDAAPKQAARERHEPERPRRRDRETPAPDAAGESVLGESVLWDGVVRNARIFGVIWIALVAINLATGGALWAQWPGVAMLTLLAWQAAPVFAAGRFSIRYARLVVIVGMLVVINLLTWSGTLWVLWPAGALLIVEIIRRLRVHA